MNNLSGETKILIVDDVTANLDLLRDMLKPGGYQIFFATSGEAALRIASSIVPDIILLDVMMPEMDGFETCRHLKRQAELQDIPVIFITAKTEVEDLVSGFEAGAVDYITKPVKQPEVHARVQTHTQIRALVKQQKEHLAALEQARIELQELNDTKDKFLSNLGHEVRDSLAQISSASAMLKQSIARNQADEDESTHRIEATNRSAQRVLRSLETILEWPRVQAGQKLDLLAARITDRELGNLVANLHKLRFLSLAENKITDVGLLHLEPLVELQELHLDYTEITDQGLATVASLPMLEILDLKGTAITDEGLARLKPLRHLKGLYLTRTGISDAALAHLPIFNELQTLILWDTAITDQGLVHLEPLQELQELILWNTKVTEQGAEKLQKALPNCDVSTSLI